MAKRRSAGARALLAFLKRYDLSLADVGRALKVSRVAALHWTTGERSPRRSYREALAVWTRGEVPADAWGESDEDRNASAVQPFDPKARTGTEG